MEKPSKPSIVKVVGFIPCCTLLYLKTRVRRYTLQDFLKRFSDHDYVTNDHQVGKILKQLIVGKEKTSHQVCGCPSNQACC